MKRIGLLISVLALFVLLVPLLSEASAPQAGGASPCATVCVQDDGIVLVQGAGYPDVRWVDAVSGQVVGSVAASGTELSVNSNSTGAASTGIFGIRPADSEGHVLHVESTSDADNGQYVNLYSSNGATFRGLVVGSEETPQLSDGAGIDVDGKLLRLRQSKTPANASASCNTGEMGWDSGFVYVCVGANSWKRATLATW